MPTLITSGAASAKGFGQTTSTLTPVYIEDVFATTIHNGTGLEQTVQNAIPLGNSATSAGYVATLYGGGNSRSGYGVVVDSSSDAYIAATAAQISSLIKFNSSGIQFQPALGSGGNYAAIARSANGNLILTGYPTSTGGIMLASYSGSSLSWVRLLRTASTDRGYGVATDSSNNIYVVGTISGTKGLLAKYNSSGTLQWQRTLGSTTTELVGVAVDGSGNAYVVGSTSGLTIAKYDTSGAIQWQRRLGTTGSYGYAIAVDSSANVYVAGYNSSGGFLVAKYDTGGVIQWQKTFTTNVGANYGIALDSSGNIYTCGYCIMDEGYGQDAAIFKYDNSGTLLWQRRLGQFGPNSGDVAQSIAVDAAGSLFITGQTNPNVSSTSQSILICKLPTDGSGVGSYVGVPNDYEYSAIGLTSTTSTLTDAVTTLTDAAGGATASTPAYSASTSSLLASTTALNATSAKGGLVWLKSRSDTSSNKFVDTARGATKSLSSDSTVAEATEATGLIGFNNSGFSLGADAAYNSSSQIYTAWTFAKQKKFFDIVTFTAAAATSISHNLGSSPGCVIVKSTTNIENWWVFHRSLDLVNGGYLILNAQGPALSAGAGYPITFSSTTVDFSQFFAISAGQTYVAYIFAHNAGGFGASGVDDVITCSSFTTDASGVATVSLGWEPQYVLYKRTDTNGAWNVIDTVRSWGADSYSYLQPNLSNNEVSSSSAGFKLTSTGFSTTSSTFAASATYVYMAIRRGPGRTPTNADKVFCTQLYSGTNVSNRLVDLGIASDMFWARLTTDAVLAGMVTADRIRGQNYSLTGAQNVEASATTALDAQLVGGTEYGGAWSSMNGVWVGNDATAKLNQSSSIQIIEGFKRAPKFFDVVRFTTNGSGAASSVPHALQVAPELVIMRPRNDAAYQWYVYHASQGGSYRFYLNTNAARQTAASWFSSTSTTFTASGFPATTDCFGYLWATLAGISKVGQYTGTAAAQNVNCSFSNGARLVLIKRADSTGDWYLWDTARGISSGNDPYLLLDSTAAEVAGTNYIGTFASGFALTATAPADLNASGGTYIYLAIA